VSCIVTIPSVMHSNNTKSNVRGMFYILLLATVSARVKIHFTLFEPCIAINLCNNNQQNTHSLQSCFNLIIVSSTCFEHPSVHPQEDLYMQLYGISVMRPYQQSGRW
jgi:hypothetical protein